VLALHRASKTIHVDDTLMYVPFPAIVRALGPSGMLSFHPTLKRALQKRAGAAGDFRAWAEALAEGWRDAENLCAAHTAALLANDGSGASIRTRIVKALERVDGKLRAHERKYG
jgi:hypothetical protein